MKRILACLKQWMPLSILILILFVFLHSDFRHQLSFEQLKNHQSQLLTWTNQHLFSAVWVYVGIYVLAVAVSLPGAVFITLAGGFLFGPVLGFSLVVFSATIGATILFFAVKTSFGQWISTHAQGAIQAMRSGFQNHAFSYLMFLRFIPIFPFWLVNIVPAMLGVKPSIFILATFIGIMPGSAVYVWVGSGLSYVFAQDEAPNLSLIRQPEILYPFIALGLLSLVPIVVQKIRKK